MDGEDIQILVSRVAESKGYLCWALENSTDDSARDLQCIWKSVKLLTYDDADRSFLAESEDEEKPQWIPYSEIRRHEQTDSRFLSSIQSARTLRKEFEHHLTLEYAAKSMLPSLQNLVSVFPQTEIAQVFRGCEKSLRIKNKENSSFSSDILLQELSRELEAEYLSAQVKSALTWKTHFSTFLKKVEKRHGLCLPQENIRAPLRNFDNSIHVSSPLNTADLVRVQNPVVQEAMIQLKTQLTTLLRPSILSTFEFAIVSGTLHNRKLRDGLDVRIDPADGHISITFDAFLQATEVFQSEFKDTIRVQVPNITKQIALSLNQCPGINGPKMVTVMAISVLIPLIRAKIMETYRLFEANKLRVRLNTMLYQDNNQPTHKNQSRFGNFQVAFDNDLAAQYEVLETCFLGWLEDIECQLPAETFHSSPSDVGFLETLFTDTMTDSVSLTMDLLSDARSTFAEYILRLRRVEAENLDVQTYLDNRQTQLNILDSLEKYATIRSPILRRGIFEVTFDVLLASIGQVVGMGRLILQEQCSDYLVSNIESLNARFAEYLKLPEPVTFEQTKNASNALKTISNSIPNIEAKIYSNFQIFVFVHEHSWLLDDLVVEDLFAATQSLVQLGAFIELRSTQVKAAFDKLRNNIGREIEMFMSLWTGVESAMTKLFTQQPKQAHEKEITENMASKAKEKRSTIDSLPTDLSTEESVMAALNYIIRHISNAADIANVISKKIDVLDNVPRTEEMRQIWSFMKSRNVLVQTLMKTRQKLRDWRTKPILTVDVGECERESKAYLQVLTDTDLIKSFLVQSSRKTLQDFVQKEIPMIQELKNSIFQVIYF